MFGDAMYEEDEQVRPGDKAAWEFDLEARELEDVIKAGGFDEQLRRREAIARLLREVGGR